MVEIGGIPILWHIMKGLSTFGINEFVICAGYKQELIKQYFANYPLHGSDITFDFRNGGVAQVHHRNLEPWLVSVVDTGLHTMTGGRVKRIRDYTNNETFLLTYGDGLSDVNIADLLDFHRSHGKMITLSAYNADQRFGVLDLDEHGQVREFREKTSGDGNMINIGFMAIEPEFLDLIDGDDTTLEREPLERAAKMGQLVAYRHDGFWQCMDTAREKDRLEELWATGAAPWRTWGDQ